MADSLAVQSIDRVMRDYYKFQSTPGYDDEDGVGLFVKFAEDNGYGTEEIQDELEADDPEESTLADCIEIDDFPSTLKEDRLKRHYIFQLIKLGKALADTKRKETNWTVMTGAFNIYKHHGKLCPMSHTEFAVVCAADISEASSSDNKHKTFKHKIWVYDHLKSAWRYANEYDSWSR